MTDISIFKKSDWSMGSTEFNAMVSRAQSEVGPVTRRPIRTEANDGVYTVYVHGPIVKTHDFFSLIFGCVSSEDIEASVIDGQDFDEIVLDMDTPGGEVLGGQSLVQVIRGSSVPIRTHVSGLCASMGYYIASATNSISAVPDAVVGSIGTLSFFTPEEDEDGMVRSANAENKNTEADAQQRADSYERMFHEVVAEGRGVTRQQIIDNFGKGMAFVATEAPRGMIDEIILPAAPSAQTTEDSTLSQQKDGAVTLSAEEKDQIREQARAELLQEQEDERREEARLKAEADAAALKRSNDILSSEAAKDRPESAKRLAEDIAKFPLADHAIATLEMLPVENEQSSFERGTQDPANHNTDVPNDAGQSEEGDHDMTDDQLRLHAAMSLIGDDEKAAEAVANHKSLINEHGSLSKGEPITIQGVL